MARVFAVMVQILLRTARRGTSLIGAGKLSRYRMFVSGHWRSVAVQFVSEPEICHGAGFKLRADARVRVQQPLQICLGVQEQKQKP